MATNSPESDYTDKSTNDDQSKLLNSTLQRIRTKDFGDWYRERKYRRNIENGTPYFNCSGSVPDPERHSPSKLLQCHRKIYYRQTNAPEEQSDPNGIFWFGTRFEEDVIFPFLREEFTDSDTYVSNTIWTDYTVQTDAGEIQIKGATDPVIVDADAEPILPTEVKTKESVDHVSSPSAHHRAQLHAYMWGLSEKHDTEITDGVIIYGSRKSMDVEIFHVKFDTEFWEQTVLEWASNHTEYRLEQTLPPAKPEHDWECKFCAYRERCGKGDSAYADLGSQGFLPGFKSYPRNKVKAYLESHEDAKLTPTLSNQHPELAEEHGLQSWECPSCSSTYTNEEISADLTTCQQPLCPQCADSGTIAELQDPFCSEDGD
jgi:CRISPR-associated exonuclease Cas4